MLLQCLPNINDVSESHSLTLFSRTPRLDRLSSYMHAYSYIHIAIANKVKRLHKYKTPASLTKITIADVTPVTCTLD